LQQQAKKEQNQPSIALQNLLLTVTQKGNFTCRFVGLHYIHNYLMQVREKLLDKGDVLILDLRASNPKTFDELHLFKSQIYSLPTVPNSRA
jgi:hypothetical protein